MYLWYYKQCIRYKDLELLMGNENKVTHDPLKEIYEHTNSDFPLAVYFVKPEEHFLNTIPWHWHEEIEIDLIQEGDALYTIGDEIYRVTEGSVILIKSNVVHSIESEGKTCSIISLIFSPSIIVLDPESQMNSAYVSPLNLMDEKIIIFNATDRMQRSMISYIRDIIDLNLARDYGYELLTKSTLYTFWYYLLKEIPHKEIERKKETQENRLSADEERIKDAITFIQENYSDNISLDDIALSVHISKSECCRLFKRTIDMTPFEYLMRYRIFTACDIMLKSQRNDESIFDLAIKVGFNSASYFNKLFKKYVGCTPSEYKKQSKTERRDKLSPFGMSFTHI